VTSPTLRAGLGLVELASERKKRAADALACNGLVQSWPEIARLAREGGKPKAEQVGLFGETEE
jgi:putative DNA methylase